MPPAISGSSASGADVPHDDTTTATVVTASDSTRKSEKTEQHDENFGSASDFLDELEEEIGMGNA